MNVGPFVQLTLCYANLGEDIESRECVIEEKVECTGMRRWNWNSESTFS